MNDGWNIATAGAPPASECERWLPTLSAYVDGELELQESGPLLRHIAGCRTCTGRLQDYRALSTEMRALPASPIPVDLGLKLRVAASHYSVRNQRWLYLRMRWAAALQAMALPTAVGTVATLFLFLALAGGVRSNIVNNPMIPDVPLFGYATAPVLTSAPDTGVGGAVLVEAQVDASGHVYSYRVIYGAHDPQTINQLNNQLLMSLFQPATTIFGQATNGSVLVSFGTVDVRG
ncbi:MAG: anti-sigma factor family protein [Terriglobales bacterium]